MLNANAARNVVGIIGNVISFALFLSPVLTFYRIWKNKAVEDFSPIPYIATLLNCMMWIFYGLPFVHPHSILVVTINGTGFALEIIYLCIYLFYATKKQRLFVLRLLSLEVAFMVVLVPLVLTQLHTYKERTMIVGILCVIFGICMYVSPLSVMKMVIKTKSVKYMPFYLSLAAFLNGACWTAYALIRFDLYITIPNGLGTISGVAQLILYGCYYRTTVWGDDERKLEAELQLPTTTVAHKS